MTGSWSRKRTSRSTYLLKESDYQGDLSKYFINHESFRIKLSRQSTKVLSELPFKKATTFRSDQQKSGCWSHDKSENSIPYNSQTCVSSDYESPLTKYKSSVFKAVTQVCIII